MEMLTNISILGVCLLLGYTLVRDQVLAPPAVRQERRAGNVSRGPEPGKKLSLPNINWARNGQTLLIVLSRGCRFCTESAEFYRKLAHETAGRSDLRLVAVFPHDVETGKKYLNEFSVPIEDVMQASLGALEVRGTPTLILVDNVGVVKESWIGRLPAEKEMEVLGRLK
jgi:hypothetical protein